MSCYFRHLQNIFSEAGIQVTPANRKQLDLAIHELMGVDHKHCPTVWKKLKQEVLSDEDRRKDFVQRLKAKAQS